MQNVCVIGIGGAATNFFKSLFKSTFGVLNFKDKINIKYGYISPRFADINYVRDLGINNLYENIENRYKPIINRTIIRPINYIAIGKETCNGLQCEGNPEIGEKAYNESRKNVEIFLNKLLKDVDIVITMAAISGRYWHRSYT